MKILDQPKYFRGFALGRIIYEGKVDLALEMLTLYSPEEMDMPKTVYDIYQYTMDNAARAHSLELLKKLHERKLGLCTANAMDTAATIGDLEMVCFLDENRTEGCSCRAFKKAKKFHHQEILAYLDANRPQDKHISAPTQHQPIYMLCTIQ
ncbi:hypothetical protein THRCLA_21578 [Thraustotheca clavata]|uniref:Uncharacterized protein n=1 Tax=Thraustotheca clavata TaxID=74557 RepID=A0A1V9ZV49_9STRA|nr:hypothetical protein THRCLA_21578 [Thraustotheca clavata]